MALKTLNPRQRDAVRRLVVGESPVEVSEELGISADTVRRWIREEPVFQAALSDLQLRMETNIVDASERLDALDILNAASAEAAAFDVEVMSDVSAAITARQKSAWDILDRSKGKPLQRTASVKMDITDLIIAAHDDMRAKEKPFDVTPKKEIDNG